MPTERVWGWVPEPLRRILSRENYCAGIQTPNHPAHSLVAIPATLFQLLTAVINVCTRYCKMICSTCVFATVRTQSRNDRYVINGSQFACGKTVTQEAASTSGCAVISHSLGATNAFSAQVLRSCRHRTRVYAAEWQCAGKPFEAYACSYGLPFLCARRNIPVYIYIYISICISPFPN